MSAEPSMEEILSSIKRIIAEEGDGPARHRRTPRAPAPSIHDDEPEEVLELSDPMPTPSHRETPIDTVAAAPEPKAETPPWPTPTPPKAPAPPVDAPILSQQAAAASRTSLDSLTRLSARPDTASDATSATTNGALEGLVREMLRPMLREWLDAQLPAMVEKMVAAEIARITGQSR